MELINRSFFSSALLPKDRVSHAIFAKTSGFCLEQEVDSAYIKKQLGCMHVAASYQVHSDQIALVDQNTGPLHGFDALITQTVGVGLVIRHADCQCAFFYDPCRHAIAAVHSGWRGSCKNIYGKTIKAMQESFATDPRDLLVVIGPSLGPKHAQFCNYRKELPGEWWQLKGEGDRFDFWAISREQLMEAGVPYEQIEIAQICTFDTPTYCYSYRRDGHAKQAHAAAISLK